ncbi:Protein-glutamate methylesterase [Luteimonas sp. 9C]|uniref:chemotaxis protein CheB n=1 Tax=Luteimonas sp. 9C TaxID=2653148 RepID=UPI0012EF02FE|nr:chemotaxis protein CheB [Luteimonas sp. 9C]VXB94559.1 Protein-glutamate methylesterase [Luteimonas sp. 9C]
MTDAVRTVVLARAGAACDRVIEGLAEAGAELVATLDPSQHAADAVEALSPSALVVVLEPADEDALEAFEPAFSVPGRTVIFEEAALVLERSGWDAARWVRHLAAKLRGGGDVLPPSAATDTPVEDTALALELDAHRDVPSFVVDPAPEAAESAASSALVSPSDDAVHLAFDPVAAEFDAPPSVQTPAVEFSFDFELAEYDETSYTPPAVPPGEVRDLNENLAAWSDDFTTSIEPPAAAPSATEAGDEASVGQASEPTVDPVSEPLTLLDDDALPSFRTAAAAGDDAPVAATPAKTLQRDLSELESRISGLSLTDTDSYGHGAIKGVVLIEGGLGGPDAVRQLLGALPEGFPRPVLVRLQLDGGRYDRLVRQMERATAMPVQLAEAGMTVSPGEVYFLPPDLLPTAVKGELQFAETADVAGLADAVPADDSALLFLSGADAALVDVAMGPAWQGALVGGQSEEGCYDPGAARAVAQRGGPSGSPTDIADWLIARWMPSERHFDSGGLSL